MKSQFAYSVGVFTLLLGFSIQTYAGDLLHVRKRLLGPDDQKAVSSEGSRGNVDHSGNRVSVQPANSSKYLFDPRKLVELQYQANLDVDKVVGFNPETDREMQKLKKPNHAAFFLGFLKSKLADQRLTEKQTMDYDVLLKEAKETYEINHDAILQPIGHINSGEFLGTNRDGNGSYTVYANKMLIEYRMERVIQRLHELLKQAYPGKIMDKIEWPFNNVGGIYARLGIAYCSPTEYLAFFATTTNQSGFSGVYPSMNVADIMFSGWMIGEHNKYYTPMAKSWSYLAKDVDWTYQLKDFAGMVDLGQGNIAANFWEGIIAPAVFVNHDWSGMETQMVNCVKSMALRAWYRLGRPEWNN